MAARGEADTATAPPARKRKHRNRGQAREDAGVPKKPLSAYNHYCSKAVPLLQAQKQHKEKPMTALVPLVAAGWKAVKGDAAQLAVYAQAAKADKARYAADVVAFRAKLEGEGKSAAQMDKLLSSSEVEIGKVLSSSSSDPFSAAAPGAQALSRLPLHRPKAKVSSAYDLFAQERAKAAPAGVEADAKQIQYEWGQLDAAGRAPYEQQRKKRKAENKQKLAVELTAALKRVAPHGSGSGNAYSVFRTELEPRLLAEKPSLARTKELTRLIGEQWAALEEKERKEYARRAKASVNADRWTGTCWC